MWNKTRNILVALGLIFLVLVAYNFWLGDWSNETIRSPIVEEATPSASMKDGEIDYNDEFKEAYMEGCAEEGGWTYCLCTFNYLQGRLGRDGMLDLAVDYAKDDSETPQEMTDAASACL